MDLGTHLGVSQGQEEDRERLHPAGASPQDSAPGRSLESPKKGDEKGGDSDHHQLIQTGHRLDLHLVETHHQGVLADLILLRGQRTAKRRVHFLSPAIVPTTSVLFYTLAEAVEDDLQLAAQQDPPP